MELSDERKAKLRPLGLALFGLEFPVGLISRNEKTPHEITYQEAVCLLQTCDVPLGYVFKFNVAQGPFSTALKFDYAELRQHTYILHGFRVDREFQPAIEQARKLLKVPSVVAMHRRAWIHALCVFNYFWLKEPSRFRAESALAHYHPPFADEIESILEALRQHRGFPG